MTISFRDIHQGTISRGESIYTKERRKQIKMLTSKSPRAEVDMDKGEVDLAMTCSRNSSHEDKDTD